MLCNLLVRLSIARELIMLPFLLPSWTPPHKHLTNPRHVALQAQVAPSHMDMEPFSRLAATAEITNVII
jgi:hypothetical protein